MAYDFSDVNVVIIDPNKVMGRMMRVTLQALGFKKISTLAGDKEDFELIVSARPNIVIIDVFGAKEGEWLVEQIRRSPRTPDPYTPIILVSGFTQLKHIHKGRDLGVNEIIVKPYNAKAIYKKLREVIENPRQYVSADSYFGPDRRRLKKTPYKGPDRRIRKVEDFLDG